MLYNNEKVVILDEASKEPNNRFWNALINLDVQIEILEMRLANLKKMRQLIREQTKHGE